MRVLARAPSVTRRTPFADLPELLRVEEVSAFIGTSKGIVYAMIRSGQLPCRRFGRLVRVPKAALVTATDGSGDKEE